MQRSSIVRVLLVATLLVGAGCLGTGTSTAPTEPSPTTSTPTATPAPETVAGDAPSPDGPSSGTSSPSDNAGSPSDGDGGTPSISPYEQPDPDKAVILTNRWNERVEIHVTVHRNATDETVYEATHEVVPGAQREVYNLQSANPDGIETFYFTFSARNASQDFSIETDRCYGNVYGEVDDEGSFYAYHTIC